MLYKMPRGNGLAAYCGPTALAGCIGESAETFAVGCGTDGGMSMRELRNIVRKYHPMQEWHRIHEWKKRDTLLYRFVKSGRRGIVMVRDHYIAIDDFLVLDTTSRIPTWVCDHRYYRYHVQAFIAVPERS